ncbi:hypothetical protein GCM10010246_10520 [Streptomyces cuspidosporus]|uniref:Chaplin domain-containing protein n=1 Tax=Streptomyces cuspidosporus TaxID=66882 RepID=A0ABN3FH06_9ACTN
MTRTTKCLAVLAIAAAATIGTAIQPIAFAVANDTHAPLIGSHAAAYANGDNAGPLGEGHSPVPSPQ